MAAKLSLSGGAFTCVARLLTSLPSVGGAEAVVWAQDTASVIPPDHRFDVARKKLQEAVASGAVPGMAIAVAVNGKIVWEEGFGWANREERTRAGPHTMFGIGSISKSMTATALMLLVRDGLVNLDRPANDYLGVGKIRGFAGDPSKATLRLVLSHKAGLPRHHQEFYADEGYSRPSMDETILRYGILVNPPGERFVYANLDYGIVDYIIERLSGRPYEEFMETDLFTPLGLTRTYLLVPPKVRPGTAVLYDDAVRRIPYFDFDQRGGGAIFSSVHDLLRFGMFHLKDRLPDQRQILPDSLLDAMYRIGQPVPGLAAGEDYALGWRVDTDAFGYRVIQHSGGMSGGAANLRLIPSRNIAVAAVANLHFNLTYNIADDILAALLPDYARGLQDGTTRTATRNEPRRPAFEAPAELLGEWVGQVVTWERSVPITVVFKPGGDVHVKLDDQLETTLNRVSYTDGSLGGRFAGRLTAPDIARRPHILEFENVRLRDGKLVGALMAIDQTQRSHYALPSWVELRRP